jgi:rRNA-processing protein FCF1
MGIFPSLDLCNFQVTIDYMHILMDSDCLIKLTKTGLKESICKEDEVTIPSVVKKEVVEAGKSKGLLDAELVEKNIEEGLLRVIGKREFSASAKGDQALIETFNRGGYEVIATDDIKLIRSLKSIGIRFILPGLLIYSLYQRKKIDRATGLEWLEKLSSYISNDESSMVRFLLEEHS